MSGHLAKFKFVVVLNEIFQLFTLHICTYWHFSASDLMGGDRVLRHRKATCLRSLCVSGECMQINI